MAADNTLMDTVKLDARMVSPGQAPSIPGLLVCRNCKKKHESELTIYQFLFFFQESKVISS